VDNGGIKWLGRHPTNIQDDIEPQLNIKNPLSYYELQRLKTEKEFLLYDMFGNSVKPKYVNNNGVYIIYCPNLKITRKVVIIN